jgi:hypothetical protein
MPRHSLGALALVGAANSKARKAVISIVMAVARSNWKPPMMLLLNLQPQLATVAVALAMELRHWKVAWKLPSKICHWVLQ